MNNINNDEDSINVNEIKEDNKDMTSRNFYKNRLNQNKITVNTVRTTDNRNIEINKSSEPTRRISYVLSKKNSELNNTLKEINKARAKNS